MIPLKINRKEYEIPTIPELTIKQLKQVFDTCFDDGELDHLKYLSLFTGIEYEKVINNKTNKINITVLTNLIGVFEDFKKVKPPETLMINKQLCKIEGLGLDTLGKEYQYKRHVDSLKDASELELLQWMLAVQFGDEDDWEQAENNYKAIDSLNWLDALSASWFFFRLSRLSENSAIKRIRRSMISIRTRIAAQKKEPELTG